MTSPTFELEQAKTHLGNEQLHKQHSIFIEGGKFPRSRVMDQMIFDRYLMEGLITLPQHRAAEHMLGLAARLKLWASSNSFDYAGEHGSKSAILSGMLSLGNILNKIEDEFGKKHSNTTRNVIVFNYDVRKEVDGMVLFTDSMEFVSSRVILFHQKNPLRHL